MWKIRTFAYLSHSLLWKWTFSKVSRVIAPYGQVHAKMHCVHWIVVLWGFKFLQYGLCSHLMTWYTSFKISGVMASLCQVQEECTLYVDVLICLYVLLSSYGYRYIVRRRKVILRGGSVHVNTALYGSLYSTARPRFVIHWHMKYGYKVPCKSYILFCIIYQCYAWEDRIQARCYLLSLWCFLLLMTRCFHVCCRS